ncbi:MAG TPA: glycosyltransferase family 2 protein [bacterium]|nr:glycosyltransferase family 2 protein [bacterium]
MVPVYNSAATLPALVSRLGETLAGMGRPWELIFVDDGSEDPSWETLKKLRLGHGSMTLVRLTRNFGQHKALLCGFKHARGAVVVTMDDDLQHPPEQIPLLLEEIGKGYDLVYGIYRKRKHSAFRNLSSSLAKRLLCFAIPGLDRRYSSFRAIRHWAARSVADLNTPFSFVDGSLTWFTRSVSGVAVDVSERRDGRSGYGFWALFRYSLDILSSFSDLPLRLAVLSGLSVSALGLAYGGVLVVRRLVYNDLAPGYTSVMAALLLLGGMILASQGINGEYIARINHKTSGRPGHAQREFLGAERPRRRRKR